MKPRRIIPIGGVRKNEDESELAREMLEGKSEKGNNLEEKTRIKESPVQASQPNVKKSWINRFFESKYFLPVFISAFAGGIGLAIYVSVTDSNRYYKNYQTLIEYADTDRDGKLSFNERVKAWKRMGYDKIYIEGADDKQFCEPRYEDLEKAIKSYQDERSGVVEEK